MGHQDTIYIIYLCLEVENQIIILGVGSRRRRENFGERRVKKKLVASLSPFFQFGSNRSFYGSAA